jgi:hypothetical protein
MPAAANGPGNLFISHGGSMARLAMLLMMTGHAVWCFIHSLYHRWSPNWSRLALPLTALLPVRMLVLASCWCAEPGPVACL